MKLQLMIVVVAGFLFIHGGLIDAGAKDGKQRWASRQTGAAKTRPPLVVEPGKEVVLTIVFKADEVAEFAVIGDGDAPLSVHIYDSKDILVAKDVEALKRGSDLCFCEWTPKKEQDFRIVIKNHGTITNVVRAGCN